MTTRTPKPEVTNYFYLTPNIHPTERIPSKWYVGPDEITAKRFKRRGVLLSAMGFNTKKEALKYGHELAAAFPPSEFVWARADAVEEGRKAYQKTGDTNAKKEN